MDNNINIDDFIDNIDDFIDEEENQNETHNSNESIQSTIEQSASLANYELEILKDHIKESRENQESRKKYASIFTETMIIQLAWINVLVLLQGINWIDLEASIFNIFLIGVFTQLVSVVAIIFTNIFPKDHDKNITDLQKVLFRKNNNKEE